MAAHNAKIVFPMDGKRRHGWRYTMPNEAKLHSKIVFPMDGKNYLSLPSLHISVFRCCLSL